MRFLKEAPTMAKSTNNQIEVAERTWKRRGLFAAAWAAVIGVVLRETSQPLEAAASLQFADTTTTVTNTANGATVLLASETGYSTSSSVFTGQTVASSAMAGLQGVAGLRGSAPIICGVFGESGRGAGTAGVLGYGNGSSVGVMGTSDSGMPILGQVTQGSSANTIAIYGLNYSTYTGPTPGAGGFAIYGLCANGHGLVGATATAGAAAVVGATNGVAGAYAAAFYGPVIVGGAFTVVGGPKSAAVPHLDGSHRRLYCVESPESWFEDFGKGQLECGQTNVTLDPDFAAVVDTADYHVFLTQYGGHDDLSVGEQTPVGFTVQAKNPTAIGRFSWRVVARRKDIKTPRFEVVAVPSEPALPPVPPPLPTPTPLATPSGARHHA
jgi:hypothetical protein